MIDKVATMPTMTNEELCMVRADALFELAKLIPGLASDKEKMKRVTTVLRNSNNATKELTLRGDRFA